MKFIQILMPVALFMSAQSAFAWQTTVSCENNRVRLERDWNAFQLVIEKPEGVRYLTEAGAINDDSIVDGKIVLSGTKDASWNYFAYAARDNGTLVYQIMVSDSADTLDLAVSWRPRGLNPGTYVPNFTGYKFYGCKSL